MIQHWMGEQLKIEFPGNNITVDYFEEADTNIVVYYEGSGEPARFDLQINELNYMVWVESKDWGFAEYIAYQIYDYFHRFHERSKPLILVEFLNADNEVLATEYVKLHQSFAASKPNPIGVADGRMQYSINFEIKLSKEEQPNE